MKPEALAQQLSQVVVVDVRYPNEWQAGHMQGARHVPLDYLYDHIGDLDKSRPIVTVCRSGQRSTEAAASLREEGFDAQSLDGGMQAWAARGFELVASDGTPGTVAEPEEPPDDRPPDMQRLQNEFLDMIFAVKEHFGDHEPSETEVRAYLKDRLISEGKTAAEAEEFLNFNNS